MKSRLSQAIACARMVNDMSAVNLTTDEYIFLTGKRLWQARDRALARRCVETAVQGTIDIVGFSRLRLPIEFVAAVIHRYVDPCNYLTACSCMEGLQYARNIITGEDSFLDPSVLFSLVCELAAHDTSGLYRAERLMEKAGLIVGAEGEVSNGQE